MASSTRGWLSIITSRTEVIPVIAPMSMRRRAQGKPFLPERIGDRRIDVDLVVADHAGQNGGNGNV